MAANKKQPRLSSVTKKRLKHEAPASRARAAARLIAKGATKAHALKEAGLSNRTFAKYGYHQHEMARPIAATYTVVDDKTLRLISVQLVGKDRQLAGRWAKDTNTYLRADRIHPGARTAIQKDFGGKFIRTLDGRKIRLSTGLDAIAAAFQTATPQQFADWEIYKRDTTRE